MLKLRLLSILFAFCFVQAQAQRSEQELVNSAIRLYESGRYDECITACTAALAINPKNVQVYTIRGNVYQYKTQYELSIEDYSSAIRYEQNYVYAWTGRANSYYYLQSYDKAVYDYSQALRLESSNADLWYGRANCYFAKKEYDKAIGDYTTAIAYNANHANAYAYRAASFFYKLDYRKAIEDYSAAIRLNANSHENLYYRGYCYFLLGEYDLAIADYTQAINIDPSYSNAWYSRGAATFAKDDYDKAIKDFSQAINLKPDYVDAYTYRANTLTRIGQYAKAITDYQQSIKLNIRYELAYINIISPLVRTGQFDKARYYYDQYRSLGLVSYIEYDAWKFYKFYITAVTEDIPKADYKKALQNLDVALALYGTQILPENKYCYIDVLAIKGYVLEKLGRISEARDAYHQALVVNDLQPEVKQALTRLTQQESRVNTADNIAPTLELISPAATRGLQVVAAKEETQVIGRAKDASGIAAVTVNGKTVKTEEDGLFITSLVLNDGMNDILVSALDKAGNTSSKKFTVPVKLVAKVEEETSTVITPVKGTATPKFYALIIAAEEYDDPAISDLENPVKDASEFKAILESHYTFNADNIKTLFNKNRDEIMQSIIQTSNALTADDNLVIFYAGHGIAEKDKFGEVDGYWIPSSAKQGITSTYISADDIKKALKRSNAKHILVVADACFSGAFTRQLSNDASVSIQKQYSVPSRKIMASGNMEPVPDNSRFIFYLKKHLKENSQKYLTAKKLFDGFYEAILNNSDTSPQYAAIKNVGDEGGEFVFIKK